MSGNQAWPHQLFTSFPESLQCLADSVFLLLELCAKIHWIKMNKHWLPTVHANTERMADEHSRHKYNRLKGLAELWFEGTFAQMNHRGCGGTFLEWITLVKALTGGHTPVWTFHSSRQWYWCWLYLLCHAVNWQVGTYLDTHTHWLKREKNEMVSLSLDLSGVK